MADPDQIVARNDERLRRMAVGEAAQKARARRRQRTAERAGGRVKRALIVAVSIVVALTVWGLVTGGVGTTVLILAIMFGLFASIAAAVWTPGEAEPHTLTDAPPAALPAVTDAWLDRRRRELPRLAAPQVDAISAKLATLEGQLAQVGPADPVAQDLSRLLGKHLPELVERYTRVPADQRARTIDSDGRTIETTLIDGLKVVEAELTRASDELASADRDALLVQGKFLENRYGGEALPPG